MEDSLCITNINTDEIIAANMTADALQLSHCGYLCCPPSHGFGPAMRNHLLIHYVVSGKESIDVALLKNTNVTVPYDSKREVALSEASEYSELNASPERFFIFFPADPHRPSLRDGNDSVWVHKMVLKIPVE